MSHFNGTEQPPRALHSIREHRERRERREVVPRSFHSPSMPSFVPPATGLYLTARHTPWHPTQPTLPRYSPAFFLFLFLSIRSLSISLSSSTYSFFPYSSPFLDFSPFFSFASSFVSLVFQFSSFHQKLRSLRFFR